LRQTICDGSRRWSGCRSRSASPAGRIELADRIGDQLEARLIIGPIVWE
jgi:hypothetical protein